MKNEHIMEALVNAVEETIFKEWKHEGFAGGWGIDYANFEIDGKEYVLHLREVEEGEHWTEEDSDSRLNLGVKIELED